MSVINLGKVLALIIWIFFWYIFSLSLHTFSTHKFTPSIIAPQPDVAVDTEASPPLVPSAIVHPEPLWFLLVCYKTASVGEGILSCWDEHWALEHAPGLGAGMSHMLLFFLLQYFKPLPPSVSLPSCSIPNLISETVNPLSSRLSLGLTTTCPLPYGASNCIDPSVCHTSPRKCLPLAYPLTLS